MIEHNYFHLQTWLFINEDNNFHDHTLLYNVIKLCLLFLFFIKKIKKKTLAAEVTQVVKL